MVKISVIIPVYNVEKYLEKCLDSIINQTFEDMEIICIDDGSTDSSLEILNKYAGNDKRIKVVAQENSGPSQTRNKGIELAQGEYLTFVDSDDWIEEDCLEKVYINAISNNSEVVLFNAIEHKSNNKFKKRIYLPIEEDIDYNNFSFDYNYNKQLAMNNVFVVWSKLYKTSFLKDNDLRFNVDYKMFEDVPFHIETILFAESISYVPEILYNYNRLNLNSTQTHKSDYNHRLVLFDIFDDIQGVLLENNIFNEFKLNFIEFKILQSKENLNRTEDQFKEEFYAKMRSEFIKMRLDNETLKKISFIFYRYYVLVINFKSFTKFDKFNKNVNYSFNYIDKKLLDKKIERFEEKGINLNETQDSIIISLTSFPKRMHDLHYCLYSLLTQNLKPNKLILWLAEEQFPNKEKDIPESVLKLKNNGLTIRWCEDIRSYKKLIPALKQYPNDYIVTADDDIYYPEDWLENIWEAHKKYPNSIISTRSRKIKLDSNNVDNYINWKLNNKEESPSYLNFPTNGAGTLFYPNSLDANVFNEELFLKLCPSGDDIWFWAMMVLNKTKIYGIEKPMPILRYVNIARELSLLDETTLWDVNQGGKNDIQLQNVLSQFPDILIELNNY